MGRGARPIPVTALQLTRAVLGTAYLSFPALAVRVAGNQAPEATRRVTRILGARHLLQALATAGQPPGTVLLLGAEADIAHAASMLALGLISRRWRRAALPDAFVAASLAAAGIAAARRAPQPAAPASLRNRLAAWLAGYLLPHYKPGDRPPSGQPAP